jgi:cytochrome c oxidase cbb3-type subunit III
MRLIKHINKKKSLITLMLTLLITSIAQAGDGKFISLSDTEIFSLLIGMIIFFIILIIGVADAIKKLTSSKELWKNKFSTNKSATTLVILAFFGGTLTVYAADNGAASSLIQMTDDLFWMLIAINAALFCILLFLLSTLKSLIVQLRGPVAVETETATIFETIGSKMTDYVPLEKEEEILMDHEYDGIKELDNNLPPWWVYGFYLTIVFAVIYLFHFHVMPIPGLDRLVILGEVEKGTQTELYIQEMKLAEEQKAAYMAKMADAVTENTVTLITDISKLDKGKEIYKMNCVACHGMNGEGGVGPNFADQYWIHGGDIKDLFKVIKYGVPTKGMIAWQGQLSPSQMQEVASYILTFQGTNPANGKEPQGELWVPKIETINNQDSTVTVENIVSEVIE